MFTKSPQGYAILLSLIHISLMIGWILLDIILNIFPESYIKWAVLGTMLLGWGISLVWEAPFCIAPVSYTHLNNTRYPEKQSAVPHSWAFTPRGQPGNRPGR